MIHWLWRMWRGLQLFVSIIWRPLTGPVDNEDALPIVYCDAKTAWFIARTTWWS